MLLGKILQDKQPDVVDKLNRKPKRRRRRKRERKPEYFSFNDFKHMMEEGSVYKRTKGGAYRQVK